MLEQWAAELVAFACVPIIAWIIHSVITGAGKAVGLVDKDTGADAKRSIESSVEINRRMGKCAVCEAEFNFPYDYALDEVNCSYCNGVIGIEQRQEEELRESVEQSVTGQVELSKGVALTDADMGLLLDNLSKLDEMRAREVITEEEFQDLKNRLLK